MARVSRLKVLVLGGTQFVGRHIVAALVGAGHAVSVFNRGLTSDELPAQVERLRGDRDFGAAGLNELAGRTWDACIDVSGYTPRQVRASAELLRPGVGHYVLISAVSVYGDPACGPVMETHPRLEPAADDVTEIDARTYGPLKVACEDVVQDVFQDRCALLRPQIVAGPFDPYDRFSYWVRRATAGGAMLAPGDGTDHVQVIDACDLARFTRAVCESSLSGTYNLAGPRLTWREFLAILGADDLVWVPADVIKAHGVTEFELPLYRRDGGPRSSLMHVGNERAIVAGMTLTDLAQTAQSVRGWPAYQQMTPALSSAREAELVAQCH